MGFFRTEIGFLPRRFFQTQEVGFNFKMNVQVLKMTSIKKMSKNTAQLFQAKASNNTHYRKAD